MLIAERLGLDVEVFCRMVTTTKMLFSNVLGHAAELHYEKYLKSKKITFEKAHTDRHYDYIVNGTKDQVKRFESESTNKDFIGVNLTQTHGDRSGEDAFYTSDAFDNLVLFDVGFINLRIIKSQDIPKHKKFSTHLISRYKLDRQDNEKLSGFYLDFLKAIKAKNVAFVGAIEELRKKYNLTYAQLLEKCCNINLKEIDSLFSEENFRLITGVKGFAAEEHFNVLLKNNNIQYRQDKDMYSKVDHWINEKVRVQVKTPYQRGVDEHSWAFKTHKSHGHGVKELYKADMFDIVALFVGFEIDESKDKYLPVSVKNNFIFIPIEKLERHPNHPEHLKRVSKIKKRDYKVNDLSIFSNL